MKIRSILLFTAIVFIVSIPFVIGMTIIGIGEGCIFCVAIDDGVNVRYRDNTIATLTFYMLYVPATLISFNYVLKKRR